MLYFSPENSLLEQMPDPAELPSLRENAAILALFKRHCALPDDASWTEADLQLGHYLDTAEAEIDKLVSCPFRPRSFKLHLSPTQSYGASAAAAINPYGCRFSSIRLPKGPISTASLEVVTVDADLVETAVASTNYSVVGERTIHPEIVFLSTYSFPSFSTPYPVKVSFDTSADADNLSQLNCILSLASYFYRNPEALQLTQLPAQDHAFWSMIFNLQGSHL